MEIGISQNSLSAMEHGKVEVGAEILLKIGREFGKRASRIRRYIEDAGLVIETDAGTEAIGSNV